MSASPHMDAIRELVQREARLLNDADLEAWMALYTEDGVYWMPLEADQDDPDSHDSLFYEDRTLMEVRRRNYEHPLSPSMQYPIRSSRIVADTHLVDGDPDRGACTVRSTFQAVILYREQVLYAGSFRHELVLVDGDWRIRRKRVDLLNADQPLGPIMIYL